MAILSQRVDKSQNMYSAFQHQSLGISELISSTSEGGSWEMLDLTDTLVTMRFNSMHG